MKTKILLLLATSFMLFVSCKKDDTDPPVVTFTNSVAEGNANSSGEYTMTGHITSETRLDKVTLTRQGESAAFYLDESTAKNKNEYDYSYLVTGITVNTTIIMDVYDLSGDKTSVEFLIKK
jgi:hypothetical protein